MTYSEIDQVKFVSVLVTIVILVIIARNWNKPLSCPEPAKDPIVLQMQAAEDTCSYGIKEFKVEMVNNVVQPIYSCKGRGE